jgi:2,4-dienoyl-CoA reductase-like NADH-dependent reductase (Old Yellow Enzyme family)
MKILEPFQIKGIAFRNRVVMAPMVPFGLEEAEGGAMSGEVLRHYLDRAPGGMGLMICQSLSVTGDVQHNGGVGAYLDAHAAHLSRLAEACHSQGARFFAQLAYPGAGFPRKPDINAYSTGDIEKIQGEFIRAAAICRDAGCDGVELHGAHGFFLNKMASPTANRRTDRFGGGLNGRLRLAAGIAAGIRAFSDEHFILSYRMGWNDTLDTDVRTAQALERMGIELLHFSSGIPYDRAIDRPADFPYNDVVYTGVYLKRHVKIPVTVVNGIGTLNRGNELIEKGLCDFAAYGKPFLADEAFLTHSLNDPDYQGCLNCDECRWFSDGRKCPAQIKAKKARKAT